MVYTDKTSIWSGLPTYKNWHLFTFGAPNILQGHNENVITERKFLWPALNLVHDRPSQSHESVKRAKVYINSNSMQLSHVSDSFPQVKSWTIDHSPYKKLFGSDLKVDLSSSALQKEIVDTKETEEALILLTKATCDDNVTTNIDSNLQRTIERTSNLKM